MQPAFTSLPLTLQIFCHADWASNVDDRRSTSGACSCVFLGPNHVSCGLKPLLTPVLKQSIRTLPWQPLKIIWVQLLLHEPQIQLPTPAF